MRWIAVLLCLWGLEPPAEACSCSGSQPRQVSPAPGTQDVPTNAELYFNGSAGGIVQLAGAGETIEIDLQQLTCGYYTYLAKLSLAPDSAYEVLSYDGSEVLTWFTTGSGPDLEPPGPATFDELFLAVEEGSEASTCGAHVQVEMAFDAPDATTFLLHRETSLGACDRIIFREDADAFGGPLGDRCLISTHVEGGREYCWQIRARDLAGNEGPPTTRCAHTEWCAEGQHGDLRDCEPAFWQGCDAGGGESLGGAILLLGLRRRRRRS